MKKPKTQNKNAEHVCSECANAVPVDDFKHLDFKGDPICYKCKFRKHYVLRNQTACPDKFKIRYGK